MIGQSHYIIARTDGARQQYWRSRRKGREETGWTYDLRACRSYRRPCDALGAARQIDIPPPAKLEVVQVDSIVSRVHYRLEVTEEGEGE